MDNNHYAIAPHRFECLLAAGAASFLETGPGAAMEAVDSFAAEGEWTFGHLSYEAGLPLYGLSAINPDPIGFPLYFFFHPQRLAWISGRELHIEAPDADAVYREIMVQPEPTETPLSVAIRPSLSREQYVQAVKQLQQHILRGDCYEVNFCQEFAAEEAVMDPLVVFGRLNALSPNPFSVLYKLQDKYLLCASPERFLFRQGNRIVSQPIKGTARRVLDDEVQDCRQREELRHSAKEQAENVMVVDLVRNDLSRVCRAGSVQVEELFGIYSFPQVHQMISTISGELLPETSLSAILAATFPMGSMTGAPKKRVLELIQAYEAGCRGIFSGSVGYIDAGGDFDFNVVIRSLMYNASSGRLSYQVGSAITFYSDAEKEWEECLLKGEAIQKVLAP